MRAMILAAGRGQRMGELTLTTPKPLLRVAGRYLIEFAIDSLKRANITDIVINVSYCAEQIKNALGDGSRFGVNIQYSEEPERLETGGGILKALPLLGDEPFIVMSSDIITDYPIEQLICDTNVLAHLLMVKNPHYHPRGDFGFTGNKLSLTATPTFTFASVGSYHPNLFAKRVPGFFRLTDLLIPAIEREQVTGEEYQGTWLNIGTPEDLTLANQLII